MDDVTIVGAGIAGTILTYQLSRKYPNLKISNIEISQEHTAQTYRSQFYIHRGHFYNVPELITRLNGSYESWLSILTELNVDKIIKPSYVGFNLDSSSWIKAWQDSEIPFEKVNISDFKTQVMDIHVQELYSFPHVIYNGFELMHKLLKANKQFLHYDKITTITSIPGGHKISCQSGHTHLTRQIVICAGAGTLDIINLFTELNNTINIQKRLCQVLTLSGTLPNISMVIPDSQIFTAPQKYNNCNNWLCTYGEDKTFDFSHEQIGINLTRFNKAMEIMNTVFPTINSYLHTVKLVPAFKIESKDLGNGKRPNDSFVESITNNVIVCLPTKLTLAIHATQKIINKLNLSL